MNLLKVKESQRRHRKSISAGTSKQILIVFILSLLIQVSLLIIESKNGFKPIIVIYWNRHTKLDIKKDPFVEIPKTKPETQKSDPMIGKPNKFTNLTNSSTCKIVVIVSISQLNATGFEKWKNIYSNRCTVDDYYFYVRSDKDKNSDLVINFEKPKIVFSTFNDNDYFPLIISVYAYKQRDFTLFVNADECDEPPSPDWIDESVSQIYHNGFEGVYGHRVELKNKVTVGTSLMLVKQGCLRELIFYTNVNTESINAPAMICILAQRENSKWSVGYHISSIVKKDLSFDFDKFEDRYKSVKYEKCPDLSDKPRPKLAVMLPNYKRTYIYDFIKEHDKQTYQPEFYFIIQIRHKVDLDLKKIGEGIKAPVYRVWIYNFNTYFFLNGHLTTVLPVDNVMRYDDDLHTRNYTHHQRLINDMRGKHLILGHGYYYWSGCSCGMKNCKFNNDHPLNPDHIGSPFMYRPTNARVEARFQPPSFLGGEDIALCTTNHLVCNTYNLIRPLDPPSFTWHQNDGNGQMGDQDIIEGYRKEKVGGLFYKLYCWYIQAGFIPVTITSRDISNIVDISYPHDPFE